MTPTGLYPLKFTPRFVEKIWGGRKLETVLGKNLPSGKWIGESWELYDFPPGVVEGSAGWVSSEIANGPHAGKTLHWAVQEFGADLLGHTRPVGPHGQFPLLVKFLDARDDLSVQVHPDEKYAARHPEALLKSEAWYVLESDPGSRLFKGLRPGTTREQFRHAISAGTVEQHLGTIHVQPGECHYLPSGTVHALGAGILVAEVQTPSDTTFRVYDFNRIDASTGKPRALHVEQAMQCINFDCSTEPNPAAAPETPSATGNLLVASPFFRMYKISARARSEHPTPPGEPVVLMMLEGQAQIRDEGNQDGTTIQQGETALLPAGLKRATVQPLTNGRWLEVTFPRAR